MGVETKLIPSKEKFAQLIASGLDQSDAYRQSHKVGKNAKPESIWVSASRLANNDKVKLRVAELRKPIIEEVRITLKEHLLELQDIRDLAKGEGKYDAAAKAEIARGKASGIYVEKHELTGKDGAPITVATITTEMSAQQAAEVYQKFIKG